MVELNGIEPSTYRMSDAHEKLEAKESMSEDTEALRKALEDRILEAEGLKNPRAVRRLFDEFKASMADITTKEQGLAAMARFMEALRRLDEDDHER